MLNISDNRVHDQVREGEWQSLEAAKAGRYHRSLTRLLLAVLLVAFLFLLLPWTQNVITRGQIITRDPENRPQTIQSTIEGRVDRWYVREGMRVKQGDTMAVLTEIKTEYFDPELLPRTDRQILAYREGIRNYDNKAEALAQQVEALRQELTVRMDQLRNRLNQEEARYLAIAEQVKAAELDQKVAMEQYQRQEELYRQGVKSLTDLEQRQLRLQESQARLEGVRRQFEVVGLEKENARMALQALRVDIQGKIAKTESDRFGVLSERNKQAAQVEKLENERNNYQVRQSLYVVRAPQDGYINRLYVPGIGTNVKEGEPLLELVPTSTDRAIELYVRPFDMPLLDTGHTVLLVFDGWPNFVFAGWPDLSVGAFRGKIAAVDRNIYDATGSYRVIIQQDQGHQSWPDILPMGSGVRGFILLNRVPLWYEVWRQLNGFPPDFYAFNKAVKKKKE